MLSISVSGSANSPRSPHRCKKKRDEKRRSGRHTYHNSGGPRDPRRPHGISSQQQSGECGAAQAKVCACVCVRSFIVCEGCVFLCVAWVLLLLWLGFVCPDVCSSGAINVRKYCAINRQSRECLPVIVRACFFVFVSRQKSGRQSSSTAAAAAAADSSLHRLASPDDIYIDDQHIEGSGGRGEVGQRFICERTLTRTTNDGWACALANCA